MLHLAVGVKRLNNLLQRFWLIVKPEIALILYQKHRQFRFFEDWKLFLFLLNDFILVTLYQWGHAQF